LPDLHFSLVDAEKIVEVNNEFVEAMKNNIHPNMKQNDKYRENFYFIAPLYHQAFTSMSRAVFLDASDLEFASDIKELYNEFEALDRPTPAAISIGLDLAPHYFNFLQNYARENPGTLVGKPGRLQGFNTGVVLYNFAKMRASTVYNSFLNDARVDYLAKKYMYPFALAEQDFLTNLGFEHAELFHILPCPFNTQVSLQYLRPPFEDVFRDYHYCDLKRNIKIFHLNGCGPTPEQCGYKVHENSVYTRDKSLHFYHIDIEAFWRTMIAD